MGRRRAGCSTAEPILASASRPEKMRFIPTIQDRKLQELLCCSPSSSPLPQCHFPSCGISCLLLPGTHYNGLGGKGKPELLANLIRGAWLGCRRKGFCPLLCMTPQVSQQGCLGSPQCLCRSAANWERGLEVGGHARNCGEQ